MTEEPADRTYLTPGEIVFGEGTIEINAGAQRLDLEILNTGDRPVQVGSHVHVPQANRALQFDRAAAHGHRFDIPAGTAIRFEPGVPQRVCLVPLAGARAVYGLSLHAPGKLDANPPGTLDSR